MIGLGIGFIVMSFAVDALFLSFGNVLDASMVAMWLPTSLLFWVSGLFFILPAIRIMPFRVYERGITRILVPFMKGLRRQEVLVPPDRILRVGVESNDMADLTTYWIKIRFQGDKKEENLTLGMEQLEDPMAALMALDAIVPGRVDEEVYRFIGRPGEDPVIDMPSVDAYNRRWASLGPAMFFAFALMVSLMCGSILIETATENGPIAIFVAYFVIIGGLAGMVYTGLFLARHGYGRSVESMSTIEGDELVLPPPGGFLGTMVACRRRVPLSEVMEVRKALATQTFHHIARARMASGEVMALDYGIFEALEGRPGFQREGVVLRNTRRSTEPRARVVRIDPARGAGYAVIFVLLSLMTGLVVMNVDMPDFVSSDSFYAWFELGGAFVIMLGYLLVFLLSMRPKARMQKNAKEMAVSDEGITMPNAPKGWRSVPWGSVDRVWVRKRTGVVSIVVERGGDSLHLPPGVHDELRKGGISIEDEQMLLPVVRTRRA